MALIIWAIRAGIVGALLVGAAAYFLVALAIPVDDPHAGVLDDLFDEAGVNW